MAVWRLVIRQIATLEEIERSWTFDDIYKGNAALDYFDDVNAAPETTQ